MPKLNIGFSSNDLILSKLIRAVEKTPYSHVYLRFHVPQVDRSVIYEAVGANVRFVGNSVWNFNRIVEEYEWEVSDQEYKEILQFAIDTSGKHYGILSMLGLGLVRIASYFGKKLINPFSDGNNNFICSELAAVIMKKYFPDTAQDNIFPKDVNVVCKKYLKRVI